jgi:hypothetical protein
MSVQEVADQENKLVSLGGTAATRFILLWEFLGLYPGRGPDFSWFY